MAKDQISPVSGLVDFVANAIYTTKGLYLSPAAAETAARAAIDAVGLAQPPGLPDGATHMRRPEYLTAWLFDGSVMPIWLIKQFHSTPLPETRRGHYATAVDGEFWRWFEPEKFHTLFVPVSDSSTDRATAAQSKNQWLPIEEAPTSIQQFAKNCVNDDDRGGYIEFGGTVADGRPFVICRNNNGWERFDRYFILPSIDEPSSPVSSPIQHCGRAGGNCQCTSIEECPRAFAQQNQE